jgi:hypothetical protein
MLKEMPAYTMNRFTQRCKDEQVFNVNFIRSFNWYEGHILLDFLTHRKEQFIISAHKWKQEIYLIVHKLCKKQKELDLTTEYVFFQMCIGWKRLQEVWMNINSRPNDVLKTSI